MIKVLKNMIKFVAMAKLFIVSIVAAAIMIPMMTCQAGSRNFSPVQVTEMKKIAGNWYNPNGNLVLKIDGNDYTINGCKVLSINYDFTMPQNNPTYFVSYPLVYRIYENNGYRDIYFEYREKVNSDDYYEMLIMDSKIVLRRTKKPQHFESIGGIYL